MITVVIGPKGCGKTRNYHILQKFFDSSAVIDDGKDSIDLWTNRQYNLRRLTLLLEPGDLILTNEEKAGDTLHRAGIEHQVRNWDWVLKNVPGLELD